VWAFITDRIDAWLFAPESSGTLRLRRVLRFPYALWRDLQSGQLNLHAMGLVYATLLAMIPLVAFSFALLKGFGAQRTLQPLVYEFFRPMGAGADELTRRVMDFADKVRGGLVGSVGLALLIWTLMDTIKRVEDSFNYVWCVEVPRSFARRMTDYLGLLVVGPLLFAAVIGLSRLAAESAPLRMLGALPLVERGYSLAVNLGPYFIGSALLTLMYMFVPNTRVQWRAALVGGVVAGVLWAAVGHYFTDFVLYSSRLTVVYAGFAIIIAALVWTYLGWIILLLGAQVSFYVQNPSYLRIGHRALQISGAETERLAVGIMVLVARSHRDGRPHWGIDELAIQLGYPGVAIARLCHSLERAGLLAVTEHERYLPGRDSAQIPLLQIIALARDQANGHARTRAGLPAEAEQFVAQLERSWRECCAGQTLAQLLAEGQPPRD
jgi:membrane protein